MLIRWVKKDFDFMLVFLFGICIFCDVINLIGGRFNCELY